MLNIKEKQAIVDFMNVEKGFINQYLVQRDRHAMSGHLSLAKIDQARADSCSAKMGGVIDLLTSMGYKFEYEDDWGNYGIRAVKNIVGVSSKN